MENSQAIIESNISSFNQVQNTFPALNLNLSTLKFSTDFKAFEQAQMISLGESFSSNNN